MNLPDIILPVGHESSPEKHREVTVKFYQETTDVHVDYNSWQIWFDYPLTKIEAFNRRYPYYNNTTIYNVVSKHRLWTPHYFYRQVKSPNKFTLRYWCSDFRVLRGDVDFTAYDEKQLIKQLYSLIFKGRKLYPKEPNHACKTTK